MNTIRQNRICDYIETKKVVTIRELQELCPEVSLMTIHRDLDALEACGAVIKVRGGAKAAIHVGDPGFEIRMRANNEGKAVIAHKALQLLHEHRSVFLDASTTNLMLARAMPDIPLNIFTTGPSIGIELCRLANPVVTLCGGTLNRKNMALSGRDTLEVLKRINIDLAFIGVSGCSVETGFACGTESDMLVKRLVIEKARTSVMMCDKAKFGRLMPYTFADFPDVNYLISDDTLPESVRQKAEAAGVKIL